MDIFEKLTDITDDLDTIVEFVCPELRPPVYYIERIFDSKWWYSPDYARKFFNSLPKDKQEEFIKILNVQTDLIPIDMPDSIEGIVMSVLEYCYPSTLGKSRWHNIDIIYIANKSISNFLDSITESEYYSNSSNMLRDKSLVFILIFSIMAIRKIVKCRLVETKLSELDIVHFCLLYWTAIMHYYHNNMHTCVWLPEITKLLAWNGGRYFRLCQIIMPNEDESIPLYKAIFPKIDLAHAIKPDWHDRLYRSVTNSECMSSFQGLNKLFLFHIIDRFVTIFSNSSYEDGSIEEIFGTLRPYPDYNSFRNYFNLYLGKRIYTEKIDCSSWKPDKLIYKLLMSMYLDYNDCLDAMRKEYFPEVLFDLNSLVSAACEFYDEKIHLDVSKNKITNYTQLDNFSVWLTAEWIINNRNYPFLEGLTLNELADMIGSAITSPKTK